LTGRPHAGVGAGLLRLAGAATVLMMATPGLFAPPARAEVYFKDAVVELSGTGPRGTRSCTAVLLPAQTLGGAQAPRLALITTGPARLSFGIERFDQYRDVVIVRNNLRRPLQRTENVGLDQFANSDMAKALRSGRVFFVTARRIDSGQLVSSRYQPVAFDGILAQIETHCPFDAEALISDLSERERAERELGLSQSDLALVRSVLNKKYPGMATETPGRTSLTAGERGYVRRYAAENGLPASRYLTSALVRLLKAEAVPATVEAKPPASPAIALYKTRDNRDIWGRDIPQPGEQVGISDIDIDACASRCETTAACVAFSFDRWNRKCYLKDKIVPSLLDARSTLAVKKSFDLPEVSKVQAQIQTVRNRRFLDTPIARKRVADFQQCKSACWNELRCVAFSFLKGVKGAQNCDLFNLAGAYQPDVSADSGFKFQPPDSL
jgi:hypothetical protein